MNRPLPLRVLPDRLRASLFARWYRGRHERWRALYDAAPLRSADGVRMELVPGDIVSDYIAFTGSYELDLTRRLARLADQGGTMIDVGANLGYFSLLWAARRPDNRVIAFEASPRNVDRLRRNVDQNGLTSRIEVVPKAAGAEAGRLAFDPGPSDQTGWGRLTVQPPARSVEVDVVRVDDVVPVDTSVTLLKVDTEGADAWVLAGCERLLRARRIQEIWFEEYKPRERALGITPGAGPALLRSVGYTPVALDEPDGETVQWSATR